MTTEQAYRICVVLTGFTVLALMLTMLAWMRRLCQLVRRLDRREAVSDPQWIQRNMYPPRESVVVSRQLEDGAE